MCEDTSDERSARRRGRTRVSAINKSLDLLTRRDHARNELRAKLRARDYEGVEIDSAIAQMESWNYLNESRFIEGVIMQHARRGEGPRYIAQALAAKGVAKEDIQACPVWKTIDWTAHAQQIHAKRLDPPPASWAENQKRMEFLMRKGFTVSQIHQILSKRVNDES